MPSIRRPAPKRSSRSLPCATFYIVRSIAYQMREMYHDFMQTDDIVNEGVIEIMRAIERYDESKDNKFETFISRRIRGMVIDMMRKNDWLPRNFHKDSRSIETATVELNNRLGRAPPMRSWQTI